MWLLVIVLIVVGVLLLRYWLVNYGWLADLAAFAGVLGLVVAVVLPCVLLDEHVCQEKARRMGVPYEWQWAQGCMVEPKPGKWVPLESYRVNE